MLYAVTLISAIITIGIFCVISFLYLDHFFAKKRGYYLYLIGGTGANIAIFFIFAHVMAYQLGTLVLFISFVLWIKLLYKVGIGKAMIISNLLVVLFYISKGFGVALLSIIINKSIIVTLDDPVLFNILIMVSTIAPLLFCCFGIKTYAPVERVKLFFSNKDQQRFVLVFSFVLMIYLMLINDGRFLALPALWFKVIYTLSLMVGLVMLYLITRNAVQVSFLIESEMRAFLLEKQLERQMQHYQSYQKFTESFRILKHDYRKIMASVKSLLDKNENEQAKKLLNDVYDLIENNVNVHKKYSNNLLIDAMLYDAANMCEIKSIRFSASVFIDEHIEISDLDLVRIFSNLIDNAIEGSSKLKDVEERFLEIISRNSCDNWLLIGFANAYDSRLLKSQDNILLTTKRNNESHGLGIDIVSDIIEKNGGLIEVDGLTQRNVFSVSVFLPIGGKSTNVL